jgi:hypothetical protein
VAARLPELVFYGTGLALGTTKVDGVRVDLRRDPAEPDCWEAIAYIEVTTGAWGHLVKRYGDLIWSRDTLKLERDTPEEALQAMVDCLKLHRKARRWR